MKETLIGFSNTLFKNKQFKIIKDKKCQPLIKLDMHNSIIYVVIIK